jgi:hypothetical protein
MPVHSDDVLQYTLSKPIATTMGPIAYTSRAVPLNNIVQYVDCPEINYSHFIYNEISGTTQIK